MLSGAETSRLKLPDGSLTCNDREIAKALNDYFTSVIIREDQSQLPSLESIILSNSLSSEAEFHEVSKNGVLHLVNIIHKIFTPQIMFIGR